MNWLTVKECRAMLDNKIASSTVYRIAHSGKVKTTRIGRILIDKQDWLQLVAKSGYTMIQPLRGKSRGAA